MIIIIIIIIITEINLTWVFLMLNVMIGVIVHAWEKQLLTFGRLKCCVGYIFISLFLGLNEGTCQIKKNVFYFTSKPLFVLEKMKF